MKWRAFGFFAIACVVLSGACNASNNDDEDVPSSGGTGGGPSGIPISTTTGGLPASTSSTGGNTGIPIDTAATAGAIEARGGSSGSSPTSRASFAGNSNGGVAAEGGAAGSAANGEPHDHDILLACASSGCPSSFAQLTDDTSLLVNAGPSACLLEALRDRTPGMYQHNVASNSARGAESTEHVFLVRSDGTVTHTTKLTQSGGIFAANGTSGISYTDAEYCELASPTYFADCLASLQDDDLAPEALAWACLYVDVDTTWLPHCDAGSPSCDG